MEMFSLKRHLDAEDEVISKKPATSERRRSTAAQFFIEEDVQLQEADGSRSPEKLKKQNPVDYRRSTAAQFFVEEEPVPQDITSERVIELLNEAIVAKDKTVKNLQIVQELVINKEPKLLDNFLDEVVSFQHDQNSEVRKCVVCFIEEACKKDPQTLPKVIGNLLMMVDDTSVAVQKRVIQATTQLYKVAVRWLCSTKTVDEVMEATWASMIQLKAKILMLLDSENEGVRTLTIKFIETVIIAQTFKDEYTVAKEGDISLDDIPVILKIFRPKKMEEEAKDMFEVLIKFHGATHISGYNLMTCMQSLATIARKRFEFFPKVLQAFESLHANLPPTLGQSQVSSVRKNLKLLLQTIAKHPASSEFYLQISTMLSDLGATPQQIAKSFPKVDSSRRKIKTEENDTVSKKVKYDDEEEAPEEPKEVIIQKKVTDKATKSKTTAIDVTAEDLFPRLVGANVSDLVLVSMLSLPDVMPAQFQSSYTPIAAAGTEPQIRHLARLLAAQLTFAGLGKGVEETKIPTEDRVEESDDEEEDLSSQRIKTVVGRTTDQKPKKTPLMLFPTGSMPKNVRLMKRLNLLDITKPMVEGRTQHTAQLVFQRILDVEKTAAKRGVSAARSKILSTLATQFHDDFSVIMRNHILDNPRSRLDMAFNWLYEEYIAHQGYNGAFHKPVERYEETAGELLNGILQNEDQRSALFGRFFYDSPNISVGMAVALKSICYDEASARQALQIAKTMTTHRPPRKLLFLGVISELTLHELLEVRSQAVNCAVELHNDPNLAPYIEAFALRSIKFLLKPVPPTEFILVSQQPAAWNEEFTKVCLHLYLALLPVNHRLIHNLGTVYVETTADVKRTILRALEIPVKGMSMRSPELLLFVENCPKGAETLVTRIIHILTDKAPPSSELVSRVRDLYHKRVPDVRFLIPIINGLTKKEVIAALPELIKLNPTVVKEVFNRLLGNNFSSPLTPAELLVALHNIDPAKCNLKTIIKATSLCFEEKHVYTHIVLATVMQQLMEQNPLPILLMRTVIQSLASYPHLLGFVTNILQRLIVKQVWKQKKIWEGFIKCCQRTKPQSFQVLLQLPAPQLEEVLNSCPDLRDPLCQHVDAFTDNQKAHIAKDVMNVLTACRPQESEDNSAASSFEKVDSEQEAIVPVQEITVS